jgi:catechol 2,3-dioxygenase-like lactoylglutathione lyase family enzyme
MFVLDHVSISVRDLARARPFYDATMKVLGIGRDEGAPAIRPEYHASYYAAFVSDPDGNRLEVVCHQLNGR